MRQLTLDEIRARSSDPVTSHEAGSRASEFAAAHHRKILDALSVGPATIYELETRTGLDHVAIARRLSELERADLATVNGQERKGPTGRACRVWVRK